MYGENEVIKLLQKMGNELNSVEVDAEKFVEGNTQLELDLEKLCKILKT